MTRSLPRLLTATLALTCLAHAQPARAQRPGASTAAGPATPWPMKVREHVDLWLHAYATIDTDTTPRVPLYRRAWRDRMQVTKNQQGIVTLLDTDRDRLATALAMNPVWQQAQFLPLAFRGAAEFDQALGWFLEADGRPEQARGREAQEAVAIVRAAFPGTGGVEFARRLIQAVRDEGRRFFHDWWLAEQRRRVDVLGAADAFWQREARPLLQPFLDGSRLADGDLLLSPVLDAEGRTQTMSSRRNIVTVTFPETAAEAATVTYAMAHEAVANAASLAVDDHTTPAQKRAGVAELQSAAAVRGGHLLLQRVAPALADGYARFYLRAARRPVTGEGDASAALADVFPLPPELLDSLRGHIAAALSGI